MSKDNRRFFERKSEWAKTKDSLLEKYLVPYTTKILQTGRGLIYVDSFAGKGMFDDGAEGSPLLACKAIERAVRLSIAQNKDVQTLFVEKTYSEELRRNLSAFPEASVRKGTFEILSQQLGDMRANTNLFLYIDPFGIKSLDLNFFLRIATRFSSVEILLNFNSFGFFRAACSAYGVSYDDVEPFDELVEREAFSDETSEETIGMLCKAAGGDYWKDIVSGYRRGDFDGYEAESRLASEFCRRLGCRYRYVLNLPIRIREGGRPKYRMVHASNHEEGCLLMYNEMQKELVRLHDVQRSGQLSLFSHDADNCIVDEVKVRKDLLETIKSYRAPERLEIVLAEFVIKQGLTLGRAELEDIVRDFEREGLILVKRDPATTATGRPRAFKASGHGKTIWVGRKNG